MRDIDTRRDSQDGYAPFIVRPALRREPDQGFALTLGLGLFSLACAFVIALFIAHLGLATVWSR